MTIEIVANQDDSPESIVAQFVAAGVLSVDSSGRVWRHKKKVGGNQGPRWVDIDPARADKPLPNGRAQVQIYLHGKRYVCSAYRLVWYLANGEIPTGCHIHHKDHDHTNNRLENLELQKGSEHISSHGIGRAPQNKGTKYGETVAYKKALESRKRNYLESCKRVYEAFNNGHSATSISEREGICRRQVYSRLQSYRSNCHIC